MSVAELGVLAAMATAISGPMVTVFIWWASRIDNKLDVLSHDVSELRTSTPVLETTTAAMSNDMDWLKSRTPPADPQS